MWVRREYVWYAHVHPHSLCFSLPHSKKFFSPPNSLPPCVICFQALFSVAFVVLMYVGETGICVVCPCSPSFPLFFPPSFKKILLPPQLPPPMCDMFSGTFFGGIRRVDVCG